MKTQSFEITVVSGTTGSGRSEKLQSMVGSSRVMNLAQVAIDKGSRLGLDDFKLPEDGDVCIDQASALSEQSLASIVRTCYAECRSLVLGTQELTETMRLCSATLSSLGVNQPIRQIALGF